MKLSKTRRLTHLVVGVAVLAMAMTFGGCGKSSDWPTTKDDPGQQDGHERMLGELRKARGDAFESDPYFATANVRRDERALLMIPDQDDAGKFLAHWNLGVGHLQHIAADYLNKPRTDEPDRLYKGFEDGTFREVAEQCGLTRSTQPMGCNFGDPNGDGYPDFYLGTGFPEYHALMPNLMFLNQGGERFVEVTTPAGLGHLQKGHATVFADLDHDGD